MFGLESFSNGRLLFSPISSTSVTSDPNTTSDLATPSETSDNVTSDPTSARVTSGLSSSLLRSLFPIVALTSPSLLLKVDVGVKGERCEEGGVINAALSAGSSARRDITSVLFGGVGVARGVAGDGMGGDRMVVTLEEVGVAGDEAGDGLMTSEGSGEGSGDAGEDCRKVLDRMARTIVTSLAVSISTLQGSQLRRSTMLVSE